MTPRFFAVDAAFTIHSTTLMKSMSTLFACLAGYMMTWVGHSLKLFSVAANVLNLGYLMPGF
jgi:hypothetical protein